MGKVPQWLMGGLLDGVHDVFSRILIPLMPSQPSATLSAPSYLLVIEIMTQYSGWVEREIDLFGRVCTSEEARFSLRHSLSSLSIRKRWSLLALSRAILGKR